MAHHLPGPHSGVRPHLAAEDGLITRQHIPGDGLAVARAGRPTTAPRQFRSPRIGRSRSGSRSSHASRLVVVRASWWQSK